MIMDRKYGKMGVWNIETPALIRFGQLTHDEYFVSEQAREMVWLLQICPVQTR